MEAYVDPLIVRYADEALGKPQQLGAECWNDELGAERKFAHQFGHLWTIIAIQGLKWVSSMVRNRVKIDWEGKKDNIPCRLHQTSRKGRGQFEESKRARLTTLCCPPDKDFKSFRFSLSNDTSIATPRSCITSGSCNDWHFTSTIINVIWHNENENGRARFFTRAFCSSSSTSLS